MQRDIAATFWQRLPPITLILAGGGTSAIALAADLLTSGGLQGFGPNQFALAVSGFAVLLAGIVLISTADRRPIGEWLLVGTAVVAVAFAADLLVINGLPEFRAKLLALASIGLGILLTIGAPTASIGWNVSEWPRHLAANQQAVGKFLSLAVELGLCVLVIRALRLENQAFYVNLMSLTFYGFLIHYFLPLRYRLPFFLLLSLAAIVGILGAINAAWLIAIGLGLISLFHLPVRYSVRMAILAIACIVLVSFRAKWIQANWLDVVWPILASMFMFRGIIYWYDLRHGKTKPTLTSTLAYFFLLPNVVFPFFPVVDYSTFRRTYYDEDQHQIYQRGLNWMLLGVIQLIGYRFINYYVVIAPAEVTNTAELVRYLIANFALYIRISGQFHLIIGLLHLFGFNLPKTHHLYFLASSFTDLWRRINIYWKDFILKVFYYPIFFKIRKWGPVASLAAATFIVFVLTWFFHAYQWFWLRGVFLLTVPDVVFWLILALLVVANTLYEARRGRKRTLDQRARPLSDIAAQALRSAATFTVMAVLWALWNSASVRDWIALLSVVEVSWESAAVLLVTFLGITAVFGIVIWIGVRSEKKSQAGAAPAAFFRTAAATGVGMLLLYLVANPLVYNQIGGQAQALIRDLTANRLSAQEAALLQQGYYEDLIGVDRFNSQLWDIYAKRPSDWPSIMETEAVRPAADDLIFELVPSTSIYFHGAPLSVNRWGMRDRDYEQLPAPDTYRVALTGPSFVMGSGVADNEVFEWLLEDRLNRDHTEGRYASYEILNFAVPGYSAVQDLLVLEQKALSFQPNALFFMSHRREEESVVLYLADRMSVGVELPYADLMELAWGTGAEPGATKTDIERHLKPFQTELLAWTYRRIVDTSRANGILPVWIFMPTLEDPVQEAEVAHLAGLAEEAGFIVLDLSDAYENQDLEALVVAYWDKHPNAEGHRLITERLYQSLLENEADIPLFR